MAPCTNFFQRNYEEAFGETQDIDIPHLFCDPLFHAAALGQFGRTQEVGTALAQLTGQYQV